MASPGSLLGSGAGLPHGLRSSRALPTSQRWSDTTRANIFSHRGNGALERREPKYALQIFKI